MRYVFFSILANWKLWSISFIWTWTILSKLTLPSIFLWTWRFGCVTQERLPFLFANRSIWILLQIPNMIDIVSSWTIIDWIAKHGRIICMKSDCYRLVSSANRSRNLVLLRSWADGLVNLGVDVAVSLLPLAYVVFWSSWELRVEIILARTRGGWLWCGESGVDRSVCHSTSWSWSISALLSSSSVTAGREQGRFRILSVVRSLVRTENRVLSVWHVAFLGSIADDSTFRSDMIDRIVLWSSRSLSASPLGFLIDSFLLKSSILFLLGNIMIQ